MAATLDQLFAVWLDLPQWNTLKVPATEVQLAEFERSRCVGLPESARQFLRRASTAHILGNTTIDDIRDRKSVWFKHLEASPSSVLRFGDDKSDSEFAFWCDGSDDPPILRIVDFSWEKNCVSVEASSLLALLTLRTTYYLILRSDLRVDFSAPGSQSVSVAQWQCAMRSLDVPKQFWSAKADDKLYDELRAWCDPLFADAVNRCRNEPIFRSVLATA
jgi:hypothetical protein